MGNARLYVGMQAKNLMQVVPARTWTILKYDIVIVDRLDGATVGWTNVSTGKFTPHSNHSPVIWKAYVHWADPGVGVLGTPRKTVSTSMRLVRATASDPANTTGTDEREGKAGTNRHGGYSFMFDSATGMPIWLEVWHDTLDYDVSDGNDGVLPPVHVDNIIVAAEMKGVAHW
jgi:hypothetical protein